MSKEKIEIIEDIYSESNKIADEVHADLVSKGIFAINVMGAPGAGKTSSLVQIIKRLPKDSAYVIEGDIESDIDTKFMRELGIETIQINTGGACHLEPILIKDTVKGFNFKQGGYLFVENIGNLVCPAEFMIGEHIKMLISTVTEGSDKPYKYPLAFEKADLIILNKKDLMPYINFDYDYFLKGVRALNPDSKVFLVSATSGEGFDEVATWLMKLKEIKN